MAVLGTLAGAALAGYLQRSGDRRARDHMHRQKVARAVAESLEAIVRHREAHWLTVASRQNALHGPSAAVAEDVRRQVVGERLDGRLQEHRRSVRV